MRVRPFVWLGLLATGCTWLGSNKLQQRLEEIDEDGDGYSIEQGDCAPTDPNRSPGLDEIPYDRIDNDCDLEGLDLFDVDQDGFPGISKEEYEALPGDIPYPTQYTLQNGEQKAVDCNDADKSIYPDPSRAIEKFYDGIDGDCQRDNDFDADQDGYYPDKVPGGSGDVAALLQQYIDDNGFSADAANWGPGGSGPAQAHDCEDNQDEVNPGIANDPYYDGVDANCDDQNDYDQDGDGFMEPGWEAQYAFYINKYYGADPPPFYVDADPFRDCADGIIAYRNIPDVATAATVYPGATDLPYDGIDADCAGDNDYDGDADGYMPDGRGTPTTLDAMNDYAEAWGYEGRISSWASDGWTTPQLGDCDDSDGTVHPNALEDLGGADQDCNLDPNLAEWGGKDGGTNPQPLYSWEYPTNPEIVHVAGKYLIIVGARNFKTFTAVDWIPDYGPSLLFDPARAVGGLPPTSHTGAVWKFGFTPLHLRNRIDVDVSPASEDAVFVAAATSNDPPLYYSYLYVSKLEFQQTYGVWSAESQFDQVDGTDPDLITYTANNVDVIVDANGGPFAVSCGTQNQASQPASLVHEVYWPPGGGISSAHTTDGGNACFFTAEPVVGTPTTTTVETCLTLQNCDQLLLTSVPAMFQDPSFTDVEQYLYGDNDGGYIALLDNTRRAYVRDTSGPAADIPLFANAGRLPTTQLKSPVGIGNTLDVAVKGTDVYAVAILDNDTVWLQYGSPANPTFVNLGYSPPSGAPTGVSVYVDDDRVGIAVSAQNASGQGDVAWMWLSPP
ncbi:MAG: putative metal-binding motif-containing protein [Alphaproteobacteria bacterium]|nr:putative metal-binding motif-containing protein [Alphaproteobacteria bacterium]